MLKFSNDFKGPEVISPSALIFAFNNGELLIGIITPEQIIIPDNRFFVDNNIGIEHLSFLGFWEEKECYCTIVNKTDCLPKDFSFQNLRTVFGMVSEDLLQIAGFASHVAHWDQNSIFCGKCGNQTKKMVEERAKKCLVCGQISYPKISPAVIVAVIKDNEILLARNKRFKSNIYSILAGFVEPGESLEDCVHREILEEVNIEVENVVYFGSQPWPFPDSLMIGFFATYKSGKIKIEENELVDAGWFNKKKLPYLPLSFSIAKKMIDKFIYEH